MLTFFGTELEDVAWLDHSGSLQTKFHHVFYMVVAPKHLSAAVVGKEKDIAA